MTINCQDMDEFMDVIYGLVIRGVMFEADAERKIIKCTGGY